MARRAKDKPPTLADLGEFADVATVARVLDVSEGLVREMIRSGQLASVRCGRLIRIPRTALEALTKAK
jgi:excisionase family DNA binding protein